MDQNGSSEGSFESLMSAAKASSASVAGALAGADEVLDRARAFAPRIPDEPPAEAPEPEKRVSGRRGRR